MIRSVLARVLLVAVGATAAGAVISWRAQPDPAPCEPGAPPVHVTSTGVPRVGGAGMDGTQHADIQRRLSRLEAQLAEAAAERRRFGEQLAALEMQLAGQRSAADDAATAPIAGALSGPPVAPAGAPANASPIDDGTLSAMERALSAAGLDAATVADVKRRQDESTMAEIYLRDRAAREGWLDSPRFAAELAAIQAQHTPLRSEIGDEAYDRYLFALGQSNRVRVEDVLQPSPAAQAGLQPGDLIMRYGETRLFAPSELVDETRSGTAGEAVPLEILRNGTRLEVEVPRGPLGLRIAAAQAAPEA
jgi:membrane-associated protease RseP (regulator of RpoE activity)